MKPVWIKWMTGLSAIATFGLYLNFTQPEKQDDSQYIEDPNTTGWDPQTAQASAIEDPNAPSSRQVQRVEDYQLEQKEQLRLSPLEQQEGQLDNTQASEITPQVTEEPTLSTQTNEVKKTEKKVASNLQSKKTTIKKVKPRPTATPVDADLISADTEISWDELNALLADPATTDQQSTNDSVFVQPDPTATPEPLPDLSQNNNTQQDVQIVQPRRRVRTARS